MKPLIPPPIVMLLAGAAMWALDRWLPLARLIAPPWNRVGALPAAAGLVTVVAAFVGFGKARTTINPMDPSKASRLVTGGIFRYTRNPMYLGLLLLLVGWALWLRSLSPWLLPPLFAVYMTIVQIAAEEAALDRLFGEEYFAYRRSVARWLGRSR
jgi:protein-S-isoprenylcysteine O-methyltransferase Ste14